MESEKSNLKINVIRFSNDDKGHECGYCKKENGSCSFGIVIDEYPVEIYEKMMKDGWRRCGDYVYIPNLEKSCCKLYTCRLNVEDFKINKDQKRVMKRFRKYLSGEYELNKEKVKKEEKKNYNEKKIIDEIKERIENILKEYLKQKRYIKIIEKYIKLDNSIIEHKLSEIYVKKNTNKKLNFDYSIDYIYIINKIIESHIKKNNIKFDDIKKLDLDLFNDFKQFYNSKNEDLELFEKTGHINIIDKTKIKIENKIENKTENKIENKIENKKKDKKENKQKKEKVKKIEKISEKYSFEYFPEIINEPEINLPLKHIYTCELTDKIKIDKERLKIYQKYQINIHKDPLDEITEERYNDAWGQSNLIDNIGIKLPNDLNKKVKHPEMYPKKYGTYNFIHRIDGKIVAVGIWDILPTCLSSVYLYYDTDYQFLDLGVFTAIREIEYVKSFHNLIDNNFKYYMMGFYCETVQKLRYKGFYEPTELLDRYTMNYVYLKDVQNLIKDGKNHKLCDKPMNPNYKYMSKKQIDDYIEKLVIFVKKKSNFKEMPLNKFPYFDFIKNEIERFLEIIPLDLIDKIKFVVDIQT